MEPITNAGLERGDRVLQDHWGKEGVVTGFTGHGFRVVFDDGTVSDGQRLNCPSPYTRVHKLAGGKMPELLIGAMEANAAAKRDLDQIERQRAQELKGLEEERIVAELKALYPNAKQDGSPWARAAANIRMELKARFPGQKFSVTSESYANGCSVNVRWTGGPERGEVESIANKYQLGTFDGMQDMYIDDNSARANAISRVLGEAKFVFCSRRD